VIRAYALIKPTIIVANDAVDSFSQPNASAATAAGNPVMAGADGEPFMSFQAAQARLGFWFAEKSPVRGHFEFDFIDFAKATPTVQALPRLRIATVEWKLSDSVQLHAGQDWDLYQPVNPHSFNLVSVAYQAGNTGFMRQQVKLIYSTPSLELGTALGMPGINAGAKLAVPELGVLPSLAVRAAALFGTAGRIGVSALASRWTPGIHTAAERNAFAGAAGLFGDVTPAERFNLRFEAYFARNGGNTGMLSLGAGSATEDIDEVGGVVSAKYGVTEAHALYVTGGIAKILNDDKVTPGYTYPTIVEGMTPAASTAVLAAGNPGMKQNLVGRLGYEYRHDKSVAFVLEGFFFNSEHVLNPIDIARFDEKQTALGAEIGLLFTL
jgi:hypothetical protein